MVTHATDRDPLSFGACLMEAELALLRAHLNEIFSSWSGPRISVDSLRGAMVCVKEAKLENQPSAHDLYLLLDTFRIYLFHDSGNSHDPSLGSLIAFLEDEQTGLVDARDHEHTSAFQFPFQLPILDLTVECMAVLQPTHYCCLQLLSGEVSFARLFPHPNATRPTIISPAVKGRLVSHRDPPRISTIRTDSTLRTDTMPQLGDLVQEVAGVIRSEISYADAASLASATTTVTFEQGRHTERCYGKALTPCQALHISRCEAVERLQVAYPPPDTELVYGTYSELAESAIDPATLFIGTGTSGDIPMSWTWAWSPGEDHWRLVPAQDIWFRIPEISNEPRLVACTTSGCSLGATPVEAAIFAAFELIERDAFLTAWYLRRPATLIEPLSARSEKTKLLVERFHWAFPQYRLVMVDLTSDIGIPTVGGFAFRTYGEGPCVYAAAATHLDREQAFSKALKDLMGFRPESPTAGNRQLSRAELRGPAAHFRHFASEAGLAEFGYLRIESARHIEVDDIGARAEGAHEFRPDLEMPLDDVLHCVAKALRAVGSHLYLTDMTHPFVRDRSLTAIRAVAPGLYPLWFGARAKRFAITDRLRALAIEYTGFCLRPESLRLTPHPLS